MKHPSSYPSLQRMLDSTEYEVVSEVPSRYAANAQKSFGSQQDPANFLLVSKLGQH
jgi:hypothetical protein